VSRIEFERGARAELLEAQAFYTAISPALGRRFAQALAQATESIARAPETWPQVSRSLRRYVVKKFPDVLLYRADGDTILIVAVAHQSRRPGYWLKRV
jgi:plasmid stabilization system protein ParE